MTVSWKGEIDQWVEDGMPMLPLSKRSHWQHYVIMMTSLALAIATDDPLRIKIEERWVRETLGDDVAAGICSRGLVAVLQVIAQRMDAFSQEQDHYPPSKEG